MSAPHPAVAACRLLQVGQLDVTMDGQLPLVPVSIDGHDTRLSNLLLYSTGGRKNAEIVWVHDLQLAVRDQPQGSFLRGRDPKPVDEQCRRGQETIYFTYGGGPVFPAEVPATSGTAAEPGDHGR